MSAPSVWQGAGRRLFIQEVGPRDGLQNEKTPVSVAARIAFVEALVADLRAHGGTVTSGHHVRTWRDVPPARAVCL